MVHTVEVNGIRVYAYHGCMKEEAIIGGHYVVDVELTTDFSAAAANDDLSETIDYVEVNHIVKEEMAIRSKLIEHVGQRIVNQLKQTFLTLKGVKVKVRKINPPINGHVEEVAIVIAENR